MYDKEGKVIDPDVAHSMGDKVEEFSRRFGDSPDQLVNSPWVEAEGVRKYFEQLTPKERQEVIVSRLRDFFIDSLKRNEAILQSLKQSTLHEYKTVEDIVEISEDVNDILISVKNGWSKKSTVFKIRIQPITDLNIDEKPNSKDNFISFSYSVNDSAEYIGDDIATIKRDFDSWMGLPNIQNYHVGASSFKMEGSANIDDIENGLKRTISNWSGYYERWYFHFSRDKNEIG